MPLSLSPRPDSSLEAIISFSLQLYICSFHCLPFLDELLHEASKLDLYPTRGSSLTTVKLRPAHFYYSNFAKSLPENNLSFPGQFWNHDREFGIRITPSVIMDKLWDKNSL